MTCIADTCPEGGSYSCASCSGAICARHTYHDRYSGRNYCPAHAASLYGQQAGIVFPELVQGGQFLTFPPRQSFGEPLRLELIDSSEVVRLELTGGEVIVGPRESTPHIVYWSETADTAIPWAADRPDLLGFVVRSSLQAGYLDTRLAGIALGLASWSVDIPEPGSWPTEDWNRDLFARAELPREMIALLREFPPSR